MMEYCAHCKEHVFVKGQLQRQLDQFRAAIFRILDNAGVEYDPEMDDSRLTAVLAQHEIRRKFVIVHFYAVSHLIIPTVPSQVLLKMLRRHRHRIMFYMMKTIQCMKFL